MKNLLLAFSALGLCQIAGAAEVVVSIGDKFAEELVETYGEREGAVLKAEVIEDIDRAFARKGVDAARVEVTINKARPNRPTLEQARDTPGLDVFRSISLGGMDLTGTAYDANGLVLAEQQYDWFENDIRHVSPAGTWTDAKRASSRFARRFADQLAIQ